MATKAGASAKAASAQASDTDGERHRTGRRFRSPRIRGESAKSWSDRVKGNSQVEEAPSEGHCAFFLKRKQRYCSMPHFGQLYCGVHRHEAVPGKERVPCPIDPSHTVFASDMKRHIHFCGKKRAEAEARPFFCAGINSAAADSSSDSRAVLPRDDLLKLSRLIAALYEQHVEPLLAGHLDPARLAQLVERAQSDGREERNYRHNVQQESILMHMRRRGLLPQPQPDDNDGGQDSERVRRNVCFVEFGAGRGMLSLALRAAHPGALGTRHDIPHGMVPRTGS